MTSQELKNKVDQLSALVSEMQTYQNYEEKLKSSPSNDRTQTLLAQYRQYAEKLLEQFRILNLSIFEDIDIGVPEPLSTPAPAVRKVKVPKVKALRQKKADFHTPSIYLKRNEKKALMKDINLTQKQLKEFIAAKIKKKEKVREREIYTIYKTNPYGKIANVFFERITLFLIKSYPRFFEDLYETLRSADIKILSKTYISMIFLSSLLSFFVIAGGFFGYSYFFNSPTLISSLLSVFYGMISAFVVFLFGYFYPRSVMNQKKGKIKRDIPFAVIHMSAVAGSGANPIAMFDLLLKSKDYPGLESEIRKIVNYVNLFGYDLPTAMRNVAFTTSSPEFKSLLNGIISNTESGGSLKDYLKEKTDDVLNVYRLDRKKYVAAMATYSDIYTGLLIAAPLLFFTTLAIINLLGGDIAGFGVSTIATVGTFAVIPLLNVLFIFFIILMEPK